MELEDKYKIYRLCKEWHFKQKKIAELYEVSPSTISKYIKEVEHELEVKNLKEERDDIQKKLDEASRFIEKFLELFNRRRHLLENGDDKRYLDDHAYRELDDDDDDDDDGNGRSRPWHGVRKW